MMISTPWLTQANLMFILDYLRWDPHLRYSLLVPFWTQIGKRESWRTRIVSEMLKYYHMTNLWRNISYMTASTKLEASDIITISTFIKFDVDLDSNI